MARPGSGGSVSVNGGGGGGGTEYVDGTANATPTGDVFLWLDAGTLRAVSAVKPLPVTGNLTLSGNDHIGQVGGDTRSIAVTPTLTNFATPYSAGDAIGGKYTFTAALRDVSTSGVIQNLTLLDLNGQGSAMRLYLFDADITAPTDNAAWTMQTTDYGKFVGVIDVLSTDWITVGSLKVATVRTGIAIRGNATANIYGALVSAGTPTYGSTTALRMRLGVLCD